MKDFGRPIVRIILHCTASSQQATVEQIKSYWRNVLKWNQVGYHYLIDTQGGRHILAHLSEVTNGVYGYNYNSCHISFIGGKGGVDNRTPAQKAEMKRLIQELRSDSILGPIPVFGHNDFTNKKLCPSFDVAKWLKEDNVL